MNDERFADELDRMVSGQHPDEADALITFAHDLQTQQGAARLDPDRRAEIRRTLMLNAASMKSVTTSGGAGPLSQPTLLDPALHNPWVRRTRAANRTPSGSRGPIVKAQTAIAIMTVFALLVVSSAWYTNQQGRDGGPGPSATRYAAAPTEAALLPQESDAVDPLRVSETDQAPSSSPAGSENAPPSPLMELLAVLPAPLAMPEGGVLPGWTYVDIDQRFEDLGLTDEALAEDPMLPLGTNAYAPLAPTTRLFDFAADEEFVEAIGFNPLTVRQVLVAGATPDNVTLLRGDWAEAELIAAWEASGYTPHTTESGVTIWSLDPDGMVDPGHPIQSRMFQELNNVVILDGGILAYAGNLGTLERVIRADAGETTVVIDAQWNQIVIEAVPEQSVSSIGFNQPGSTLYDMEKIATDPNLRPEDQETLIESPLRESREAVGPMPEYIGATFSFVDGENGNGEAVVQLGAMNEQRADWMIEVFEWRWENFTSQRYQRTFDSIMPLIDATAEGTIVTLRFDTQGTPGIWQEILLGDGLIAFAVDAGLQSKNPDAIPATPMTTPMAISNEDAAWWTWPAAEECRPEEYSEDTLEPNDYPERDYVPLGTPDREDAEAASRVARTTRACFVPYSSVPLSTSRFREENENLGADPYEYSQTLKAQNENGRAISEAFPITDPTEFGRLTEEEPILLTPPPLDSGMGGLTSNMHEPYTAVFIPSHAVQLADGRIAVPESLLGMEGDEELAYRGDPTTWVRHYGSLVVLSDESGTWLIDEVLPFCIGPDCHVFWEQNEETANRLEALATEEAHDSTPAVIPSQASPEARTPGDPRAWSECPDDAGPSTLTIQNGIDADTTPPPSPDSWLPEPAQPPTIPCPSPGPATPGDFTPVPLD